MTHSEAVQMVKGISYRTRRKVGNNTYAEILHDGSVGITLHKTRVVTIHADGKYTLRNGGWNTVTTKDRINKYAPVRVYQRDFQWYITIDGKEYDFEDGMVV